jgi:truncated hemoglobin YjbI
MNLAEEEIMEYSYNISTLCSVLKDRLKEHARIGHLFVAINDACFTGMMHSMFSAIYVSAAPDRAVLQRHKTMLLTDQDYADWVECFLQSCEAANIHERAFVESILAQVERLKQSLIVDKQFDRILSLVAKGTTIHSEIEHLRQMID